MLLYRFTNPLQRSTASLFRRTLTHRIGHGLHIIVQSLPTRIPWPSAYQPTQPVPRSHACDVTRRLFKQIEICLPNDYLHTWKLTYIGREHLDPWAPHAMDARGMRRKIIKDISQEGWAQKGNLDVSGTTWNKFLRMSS